MTHSADLRTAGYQSWKDLAFLHWRVPVEQLQRLIPDGLRIEEFDGSGWLGVVPFRMAKVRPWWSPAVPGISWFLETNVRTYVVDGRGVSGVWFFSLDANNRLAVFIARTFWHLPYKRARLGINDRMTSGAEGTTTTIEYKGQRLEEPQAAYRIQIQPDLSVPAQTASPGTLDHFLLERYLLFAGRNSDAMSTGQVHHTPYQFFPVRSCQVSQSLTTAMGAAVDAQSAPDHVVFSKGVDVRVSPLRPVKQ